MAQEQEGGTFYDFMYGKFLLKELFDITKHEDDYIEMAYNVWRDIGNIATATHVFKFVIDSSLRVALPCNVEFIEAVSTGENWNNNCNSEYYRNFIISDHPGNKYFLPDSIVAMSTTYGDQKPQTSQLHPQGEFIPYELGGTQGNRHLIFDGKFVGNTGVCIFRGIVIDKDGNPVLNRKEAEGIAYKMAMLDVQKRAFMKDPAALQMLSYIKDEAGRKMAAAKIPEYVTQNTWNSVLSVLTRHDRKVFNSSYKTIQ